MLKAITMDIGVRVSMDIAARRDVTVRKLGSKILFRHAYECANTCSSSKKLRPD